MKIRSLQSSEMAGYSALSAKYGSVFNSFKWINMFGSNISLNGIFNDNNDLIGAFFHFKASKFGMPYIANPPFTPNNGLFFINPSTNKSNQNTFEKSVMELIADFYITLSPFFFVTSLPVGYKDTQPFSWKKFNVLPKYTYRIDLSLPENTLLENLTSEKRKSLNKAEKDNLVIRKESDLTVVYDLILKTFERQHEKISEQWLKSILFEFADTTNSIAFVAYNGEKPIATSFCVNDKHTAYYILGGYDADNRHHGAGVSTMWNCITHARSAGLKVFDFEGSMIPDIEKYFREFGGTMTPYFAMTKVPLPVEVIFKLFKRKLI